MRKSPKTKALGAGTENLTANVPTEFYDKLRDLAAESGMKTGEFVRCVMFYALANRAVISKRGKYYSGNDAIRNEIETGFKSFRDLGESAFWKLSSEKTVFEIAKESQETALKLLQSPGDPPAKS